MYKASAIRTVHLELTTKCNIRCPMCLRNVLGGKVNPQLPLVELSLADIQKILRPEFVRQLTKVFLCGNYGDPAAASQTLEVLEYLREIHPQLRLEMHSNGALREEQWWARAGNVLSLCHFGIDGLEDTNRIYRRGANWQRLMSNAQAFIAAGGVAVWNFIVFGHNEHQVEEARELSQRLGFQKFVVKKTGRFFSNTKAAVKETHPVHNMDGDVEYELQLPKNPEYRNQALAQEARLVAQHGSLRNYLEQVPVQCKVSQEKSIYISAEGLVFPCCWTANQLYPWYSKPRSTQVWQMLDGLPLKADSLNAKMSPLSNIIEDSFFQSVLPESWEQPSFSAGKPFVCAKTCGSREFDPFREQFRESATP